MHYVSARTALNAGPPDNGHQSPAAEGREYSFSILDSGRAHAAVAEALGACPFTAIPREGGCSRVLMLSPRARQIALRQLRCGDNDKQHSDIRTQLRYIPARYRYWGGVAVVPPASSAE
jgi:hypothetical protein